MQTPIFESLIPDEIGVSLNDKYMMHPKKSISGILGIKLQKDDRIRPCDICERRDTFGEKTPAKSGRILYSQPFYLYR